MKTSVITTTSMEMRYVRVTNTYEVDTDLLNKALKDHNQNVDQAVGELMWNEQLSRINVTEEMEELISTTDEDGSLRKQTFRILGRRNSSENHPMRLSRMKRGEFVRNTTVHRNLNNVTEYVTALVQRLEKRGHFVEHGYDTVWHCYWIILNTGDNCWKLFPNKPCNEWPL